MGKAQSELLGLAMVVLLIALGLVFLISFMLMSADTDVRREFVDKQLAINTLNSILDTNSQCRNNPIDKLIVDCATNKRVRCGSDSSLTSCEYLFNETHSAIAPNGVMPYLLNTTLGARNDFVFTGYVSYLDGRTEALTKLREFGGENSKKGYYSNIYSPTSKPECPRGRVPGIFPLPIATGTIFLELYICE